ncbi:hypothetical protein CspeluHIS016_0309870 [Cutaneotrichosporon spelunceum]|uniref:Uncharacterized protein n=1 Tax=Cutaneotrichosporon spelunceum TaxID=1672016 RepID=A0AAD3TVA8_9TREE|nr:hypothetical protein CspeluHIS016_0309870 [Cutaneotrichosporon spelunceum]
MASGWDNPRLRQRPTFLTTGPTRPASSATPREVNDHGHPGPSPWPKTPSIPWYDRNSPSSATPPSVGLSAPSAPSGASGQTTSSTIQYLRLAFQETPPKLKELEEGWRIARRAASRPPPVVVVTRASGKDQRHSERGNLRSVRKGERGRDDPGLADRRRTQQAVPDQRERTLQDRNEGRKFEQEPCVRREHRQQEPARLEQPAREPESQPATQAREQDGRRQPTARERYERRPELGPKRRIGPICSHDPPTVTWADNGKQRAVPDERSVGQSTGLLTPPESPAPRAALARQRPRDTPRPLVRFVSPPPPGEPESGPSGSSGLSRPSQSTSGPSQPSRSSQPSSTVIDDTPTPALRPTAPSLRVMSVVMPREIPPALVSADPPQLILPYLPPISPPPPARVPAPEPSRPASARLQPVHQAASIPTHRPSDSLPNSHPKAPEPILVQPLPPTRHLEPLSRKSSDTIAVHQPTADVALTLNFHRQTAYVNSAGDVVTIEGRGPQVLRLADSASWSASQRHLWQLLARLVREYKRRTPRIKVFTPLGELVVTCCEPPDIVLSYLVEAQAATKVRLRYSLSSFEAVLDTSSHRPRGTRDETHRTRRSIPLRWSGEGEGAALALGVDCSEWESMEKDAVRRLWTLREDWARFVPGYNH